MLHLSICAIIILLSFVILPARTKIPHWLTWLELPAMLCLIGAWTYGVILCFGLPLYAFRAIVWLFNARSIPLSRDVRGRVEAYLRAKAEYNQALKQAELDRRRRQEDYWCKLSGRDFEKELARLYKLAGYAVETTPVTGDDGADLLLRKEGRLVVV